MNIIKWYILPLSDIMEFIKVVIYDSCILINAF